MGINQFLAIRVYYGNSTDARKELSITGQMTGNNDHSSTTNDPLASQRLALLGPVVAAQFEIERMIATLRASGASAADAEAQLGSLVAIRQDIATAGPAELPGLRRMVGALVASSAAAVQQAQAASAARSAEAIAAVLEASHRAVDDALAYTRGLTLHFASAADEQGYRDRQAERSGYIAAQQAKQTPTGDLNAAGATVGQMVDAKAHGAGGPEFDQRWNELVTTTAKLREAVRASGGSTQEFDDRLRADLRGIMKDKGISDAEIDARFAANRDPLEAAKAFVASQGDLTTLDDSVKLASRQASAAGIRTEATADAPAIVNNMAEFRAAGIMMSDQKADAEVDHGLAMAGATRSAPRTVQPIGR